MKKRVYVWIVVLAFSASAAMWIGAGLLGHVRSYHVSDLAAAAELPGDLRGIPLEPDVHYGIATGSRGPAYCLTGKIDRADLDAFCRTRGIKLTRWLPEMRPDFDGIAGRWGFDTTVFHFSCTGEYEAFHGCPGSDPHQYFDLYYCAKGGHIALLVSRYRE